ncbi:hypothetical protein SDC9_175056 [bioreactor metagenome]|uniref:Uncharacterized protein n=1 Tax=bioreactor metagenome TaxID=1076179 RepID=A0A645GNZ0_9ZZZZ
MALNGRQKVRIGATLENQHLPALEFVPRKEEAVFLRQNCDAAVVVRRNRDDLKHLVAEVYARTVRQHAGFVVGKRFLRGPLFVNRRKPVFAVALRRFPHPGFRPAAVSAGMVEVPVRIDHHDRQVRLLLHHRANVSFAISGIDQHRLTLPDEQILKILPSVRENPKVRANQPAAVEQPVYGCVFVAHAGLCSGVTESKEYRFSICAGCWIRMLE